MYSDYAQLQQYDEHLKQKAQEFQNAQMEAAWVKRWLRERVNGVGYGLVICGQWLQALSADKQSTVASANSL